MEMINWKVRLLNKNFWLAIIPAAILLIQAVADAFGVKIDLGETGSKLIAVVNAAFVVLAILGIIADPTTEGMSDSIRALTYDRPKPKGADDESFAFTWETMRGEVQKLLADDRAELLRELREGSISEAANAGP